MLIRNEPFEEIQTKTNIFSGKYFEAKPADLMLRKHPTLKTIYRHHKKRYTSESGGKYPKTNIKQFWTTVDFDVRGQQGMDFSLEDALTYKSLVFCPNAV